MENFGLKSRTKGRELQEEERKLLRVLRLIKQNYGRVLRKIEWSRLSMVQSQDETLKNIVPQTVGPDPKVGCEALSSVSPQFFEKYSFFRHLFVNSKNSCYKLRSHIYLLIFKQRP